MCSWQESTTGHPLYAVYRIAGGWVGGYKCGDTGGVLRASSLPSNPICRRRPSDPQTHDSTSVLYYAITNKQNYSWPGINWGSNILYVGS